MQSGLNIYHYHHHHHLLLLLRPLMPELNPSAKRCLLKLSTGDFNF
jgi:hypothetical protein